MKVINTVNLCFPYLVCVQSYHMGKVRQLRSDVHRSRLHPVWAVHPGPRGGMHPTNSTGTVPSVKLLWPLSHLKTAQFGFLWCLICHRNFMALIPNAHPTTAASSTSVTSTESWVWWRVTLLWWEARVTPHSATLVGRCIFRSHKNSVSLVRICV